MEGWRMKKLLLSLVLAGMATSATAQEVPFMNMSDANKCAVGSTFGDEGNTFFGYGKERGKPAAFIVGNDLWDIAPGDDLGVIVLENADGEAITYTKAIAGEGGFRLVTEVNDIKRLLDNDTVGVRVVRDGVEIARLNLPSTPSGRGLTYFNDCLAMRSDF